MTTPESLYILLTAAKPRAMLARVRTLIVDEIHAVADDKRGSHLALTLARLDRLVEQNGGAKPQRIGLSATGRSPIEGRGGLVSLSDDGRQRASQRGPPARDGSRRWKVPRDELGPVATNEMWGEIYDRAGRADPRAIAPRWCSSTRGAWPSAWRTTWASALGEDAVLPHHGSLSRALRLDAERRLKNGELRAVVATASLELGIDIGTVDLVCQIGSPRSIAVALQRIGRSGHWVGALPKGRLFATTRDELVECAALVRAIRRGELDRLEIPRNALDILAQQMVAACACEDFGEDELFALMRRAWPYARWRARDFDAVLDMLSEGIATARGRSGAYLHRDAVNRRVRGRRGARLAAITSGGAIPETAQYLVVAEPEGATVGTVDEDFAVESMAGDVFLLGTTSWRIRRIEPGRVRVEDAHGAAPGIPFWLGEAPGRTAELSREVARLREDRRGSRPSGGRVSFLERECGLDRGGAEQARRVRAGRPRGARRHALRPPASSPSASSTKPAACSSSSTRPSARASTAPGAWRCASASAAPSISSCRPPPPITASSSRSASSIPFRSKSSSNSCAPKRSRTCSPRRCWPRPCSPRAGAGTPRARWPSRAMRAGARCRRPSSACAPTT